MIPDLRKKLRKVQSYVCNCIDRDLTGAYLHLSATAHNARHHFNSLLKIEQRGLLPEKIHK
jgi:hypothetical protein